VRWTAAWVVLWVACHFDCVARMEIRVFGFLLRESRLNERYGALRYPAERLYIRRLLRSHVYYFGAAVAGAWLLADCHSVNDLTQNYDKKYRIPFAAAAAHWLVSFFEDYVSASSFKLVRHADGRADGGPPLLKLYLLHHLLAFSTFLFINSSRILPGIGLMGLVYEVPVLFANARELLVELGVSKEHEVVIGRLWDWTFFSGFVCRLGPTFVYMHSLCWWRPFLQKLAPKTLVVYHVAAVTFTLFTLGWFGLVTLQRGSDVRGRAKRPKKAAGPVSNTAEEKRQFLPIMAYESVAEIQNHPNNIMNVLVVIDRIVYNVGAHTPGGDAFVDAHPGGRQVLMAFAGADATAAFAAARHSPFALGMLETLAVAQIVDESAVRNARARLRRDTQERPTYRHQYLSTDALQPYAFSFKAYESDFAYDCHVFACAALVLAGALGANAVAGNGAARTWYSSDLHLVPPEALAVSIAFWATLLNVLFTRGKSVTQFGALVRSPKALAYSCASAAVLLFSLKLLVHRHYNLFVASHLIVACTCRGSRAGDSKGDKRVGGHGGFSQVQHDAPTSMVMFFFGVYVIFQAARSASGGLFAVGDALALALATGCCDRLAFALKKPGAGPNSVEMGVFICLVASTAACAALAAEELGGGASKVVCWNTIVSPVMKSAGAAWWILRAVVAARIALFDPWFAQTCSASAAANVRLVACCAVGAFSLGWARQQCFVFALLFSHARDLYSATLPFANIGLADADVQAHGWIWPALWAADMYRYGLLAFPVFALGRLLVYLANCCIPAPLRFYCHPEASMGFDGAPAGMAHFIAPARVAEEGPVPCIFVCNVGMLERGYDAVIVGDATTKMSSTLPQTEGFAGQ